MSSPQQFNVQAKPFQPGPSEPQGKNSQTSNNNLPPDKTRQNNNNNRGRGKGRGGGRSRGRGGRGGSENHTKEKPSNNKQSRKSAEQELLSQAPRNKRGEVSISHLMDFSRSDSNNNHSAPSRRNTRPFTQQPHYQQQQQQQRKWVDPQAEKIAYINTTCRFILHSGVDYRGLMQDPDSLVPLENIMRIITQASACPICLEDLPEAPRMLECGHIMCYPCLFRFLNSENVIPPGETKPKKQKECPFCFDRVRPTRVKPVTFTVGNDQFDTPREDNDVVLKLMFRPMGSYLAVPRDTENLHHQDFEGEAPSTDLSQVTQFSRLSVGTLEYQINEYDREIDQLIKSRQESRLLYEDNGEYHTDAIKSIEQAKKVYLEPEKPPEQNPEAQFNMTPSFAWDETVDTLTQQTNDHLEKIGIAPKDETERIPKSENVLIADYYEDSNAYFFYQAGFDSITKFFLAPLDVKILRAAYGTFSDFPSTIVTRVQNVLYGTTVTPELRKRMKYLSHLPLNTQVGFLECDWRGKISDDVLQKFSKELQTRRKKKKDKDRREERDKKKYQREEEELFRQELLQESYFSTPYIRSTPIPPPSSMIADDPALPSSHNNQQLSEDPGNSVSNNSKSISFAAVASGEIPIDDREKQIEKIISEAQPKKSGGRKKLVLMSNTGPRHE